MGRHEHAHPEYLSYLLRLWHTQSAGATVWRVALEDPLTREVVRFDNLAGLFAFLQTQTRAETAAGDVATDRSVDDEGSSS